MLVCKRKKIRRAFLPALFLWASLSLSSWPSPEQSWKQSIFCFLEVPSKGIHSACCWELENCCLGTVLYRYLASALPQSGSNEALLMWSGGIFKSQMNGICRPKINRSPNNLGNCRSRHHAKHILWTFLFLDHKDLQSLFINFSYLPFASSHVSKEGLHSWRCSDRYLNYALILIVSGKSVFTFTLRRGRKLKPILVSLWSLQRK